MWSGFQVYPLPVAFLQETITIFLCRRPEKVLAFGNCKIFVHFTTSVCYFGLEPWANS